MKTILLSLLMLIACTATAQTENCRAKVSGYYGSGSKYHIYIINKSTCPTFYSVRKPDSSIIQTPVVQPGDTLEYVFEAPLTCDRNVEVLPAEKCNITGNFPCTQEWLKVNVCSLLPVGVVYKYYKKTQDNLYTEVKFGSLLTPGDRLKLVTRMSDGSIKTTEVPLTNLKGQSYYSNIKY